jgi:serine/threonine-protein kinase
MAYTIMDDPDLRDILRAPVELDSEPLEPPLKSALSTSATLDSYSYDDEDTTREYPLIDAISGDPTGRYQDLGLIGYGGMGEVRRIRDRDLNRIMAMKIIRPKLLKKPLALSRFVEEAQATAQLQHPGVVPVHEMGRLSDGRLYFTMQEIRGRTFGTVIHSLHTCSTTDCWGTTPDGWNLRRLIEAFRHVCDTMAFAHMRGVLHRDLKPENIMVGQHSEVLVVDWGLAKVMGSKARQAETFKDDPLLTNRSTDSAFATIHGSIAGTPAYMPPEQARGDLSQIGPHSDVYALGAILYELLGGSPPYSGDAKAVLREVLAHAPKPIRASAVNSIDTLGFDLNLEDLNKHDELPDKIPSELVAVCEKAMERNPKKRYANAQELRDAIEAWLNGSMRQEHALRVSNRASEILTISESYLEKSARLQIKAETTMKTIETWHPDEKKIPIWAIEDEAEQLLQRSKVKRLEAEQMFQAALTYDSELVEAHRALADLYLDDHREHEAAGHKDETTRAYELLRLHVRSLPEEHREDYVGYLHGSGSITILTDPPGADVHFHMYEEIDRRLQADYIGQFDTTPLIDFPIGMGSYKIVLKSPGREDVVYPVNIRRQEAWTGIPPGKHKPEPVFLPQEGSLGKEDCYVPAGWATLGGESDSGAMKPKQVWVDNFVVRKFPVTNREYLVFINDISKSMSAEDMEKHIPSSDDLGDYVFHYKKDENNIYQLTEDSEGHIWEPEWPVMTINWESAQAYCKWYTEKTGYHWRLLSEAEWEKSARGVDGRTYPWGNHFDSSWCRIRTSLQSRALLTTVTDYPNDCSPYGVRGVAGNTADWCADEYDHNGPLIKNGRAVLPTDAPAQVGAMNVFRGGLWTSYSAYCHTYERFAGDPRTKAVYLGFRIARSLTRSKKK